MVLITATMQLADGSFNDRHMTLRSFLAEAESLKKYLEGHHSIEEQYIFPVLAKRMPQFAEDEKHKQSHKGIHDGLDAMGKLIKSYKEDPTSYSPEKMRECLDSFRDVLMRHLDEEVQDLQAENMKKYWTLKEVEQILM